MRVLRAAQPPERSSREHRDWSLRVMRELYELPEDYAFTRCIEDERRIARDAPR